MMYLHSVQEDIEQLFDKSNHNHLLFLYITGNGDIVGKYRYFDVEDEQSRF